MPSISAKLVGDDELRLQLVRLGDDFERIVREEVYATALDVEASEKEHAPSAFGRLTTAIHTRVATNGFTAKIGVFKDSGVTYGRVVEEGRGPGKMPPIEPLRLWAARVIGDADAAYPIARKIANEGTDPQPFVGPAFEEHGEDLPERLKSRLRDALP